MAEAEKRNVWISVKAQDGWRYCSGVIVSTGHVLTASHCFGEGILVDGLPAMMLRMEAANDLMLLTAKTVEVTPLTINLWPVFSEPVYTAANHEPRMGIFSMSRIVWLSDEEVCVTTITAPGVSGSAVYDEHGRLVTIAQQAQSGRFDEFTPVILFTIGVHPKRIAAFLGPTP